MITGAAVARIMNATDTTDVQTDVKLVILSLYMKTVLIVNCVPTTVKIVQVITAAQIVNQNFMALCVRMLVLVIMEIVLYALEKMKTALNAWNVWIITM